MADPELSDKSMRIFRLHEACRESLIAAKYPFALLIEVHPIGRAEAPPPTRVKLDAS
jgi:hypothetical protein